MATRSNQSGFTAAVSEPDTRFAQPTTTAVNQEVDQSVGNLIGNVGTLLGTGATFISEISQINLGLM